MMPPSSPEENPFSQLGSLRLRKRLRLAWARSKPLRWPPARLPPPLFSSSYEREPLLDVVGMGRDFVACFLRTGYRCREFLINRWRKNCFQRHRRAPPLRLLMTFPGLLLRLCRDRLVGVRLLDRRQGAAGFSGGGLAVARFFRDRGPLFYGEMFLAGFGRTGRGDVCGRLS